MKRKLFFILAILVPMSSIHCQKQTSLFLKRIQEPREQAFSILLPANWSYSGGIERVNPIISGPANAIEAKLDFSIFSDAQRSVEIHWYPDNYYYDASQSPAGAMFPEGSNYNGMLVLRKRPASYFVKNDFIKYVHPGISKLSFVTEHEAESLEKVFKDFDKLPQMGMSFDAFVCDYNYTERGINFRERVICVLIDMGPYTAGMWKNSNTISFRAPAGDFQKWEPVFSMILQSVILNPEWVRKEIQGQIQRGQIMAGTMKEVERMDQEMQQAHIKTNAEINRQSFLLLTDKEDYLNPHTGQIETGSNQWNNRWVDDLGNVLYTDANEYNPNLDIELNMTGFKKCSIKK
ncbi:MAG: hypothetical protein K9H49_11135 [Bacteroidales bacterium]|nr:hypothetical protein [Bacteroidales bacterium]MCF8405384.1 hypothetical protein [Bacteroidales bacterium]